jgi:hypothetical protein
MQESAGGAIQEEKSCDPHRDIDKFAAQQWID